jgi:hypothetical protein
VPLAFARLFGESVGRAPTTAPQTATQAQEATSISATTRWSVSISCATDDGDRSAAVSREGEGARCRDPHIGVWVVHERQHRCRHRVPATRHHLEGDRDRSAITSDTQLRKQPSTFGLEESDSASA